MENNNVELRGKTAKFPKNTKAVKALQFLEHVKINPSKLWYIVIEDQDNQLKTVKYNRAKGVNLLEYTAELKTVYYHKYKGNVSITEALDKMVVEGEDDFSIIKNIPMIVLENGQTLISKISADLINLLAD
jgi:hypothetical protein